MATIIDVPGVFAALDNVRDHGAAEATATFITSRGTVTLTNTGVADLGLYIDGERRDNIATLELVTL